MRLIGSLRRAGRRAVALAIAAVTAALVAGPAAAAGIDPATLDPAIRPQDDLYRHVNARWLETATIPPDRSSTGTLDEIADLTQSRLRELLETAAGDDADAQKIATLYASFMDERTIEAAGLAPLADALGAVDAVGDVDSLVTVLARFNRFGVPTPLTVSIDQDSRNASRWVPTLQQGGLGLPNRDYYLAADDARFRDAREQYVRCLARLFALAGRPDADAVADARAVLALETEIAGVQWSEVQNRDPVKTYNRVDIAGLPALVPTLPWQAALAAAELAGRTPDVVIAQPSYVAGLAPLLANRPIATWKAYARGRVLLAFAPYLSREFADAQFAFVGTALHGQPDQRPRWQRAVRLVDTAMGEALGKRYVARWFPPESKARMEVLVGNLLEAFRQSIASRTWMGPATRREALAKLARFGTKIGYPERWIDYTALRIEPGDLCGNVLRAKGFAWQREIDRLGRPVDRGEWLMSPQTVNAYYNPQLNEIVFPAAFLQAPTFDPAADDALNYGAIGMVIGHEISHGFDDEGSQFDGDGNLRVWWTPGDAARFRAKTKALVDQYAAFSPLPGYFLNGELTLGENIADNSGLEIAYRAWQISLHGRAAPVIDGLTGAQRFFIGYARVWRGKLREPALLAQIKADPHSPEEFRVNGPVRNLPGFYAAFAVRPGDKMYLPPSRRVSIW